jgi:hypothetical protein
MSEDEKLIDRPAMPDKLKEFLKKLNRFIKKTNDKFKKIKNVAVRNGVYAGIFLSLFTFVYSLYNFFSTFSTSSLPYALFNVIIAFLVGFIFISLITEIVKFVIKTTTYTISQRIGIAIGFALLFAFFAIVIMLIDTKIGNPVYSILHMLFTMDNIFLKDLSTLYQSSKSNSTTTFEQIAEFLKLKEEGDRKILVGSLMKYLGVLLAIVFVCIVTYKSAYDPSAMNRNTVSYGMMIIIPLLISIFLFSPIVKMDDIPTLMILCGGFIAMMILLYTYFSMSWNSSTLYYGSHFMTALMFIIVIVGLGIFFKIFSGQLKKLTGWSGFFINLLFFLPCLLSDGLQYILHQFKITPNIVILLLFIEIVLILLYAYIPVIIDKISKKDTSTILNHPVFIDKEIPIGNSSLFLLNQIDDKNVYSGEQIYRSNYTFSMWIYLNQHSSSNAAYVNGAKIFDFGGGKPSIYYKNESSNTRIPNKDVYVVSFSNASPDAKYELHLPNQKWNNFVLNYVDSKVDLYINGSLERTFEFSNNLPTYSATDVITIGDKNGLQGAICNVNYYKEPLSSEKIMLLYNLLSIKNPPIN